MAENDEDLAHAGTIREALHAIDTDAVEELQAMCRKHSAIAAPPTQAMQPPPVTAGPSVTVPAIPSPAHAPVQLDWIAAYRQLRELTRYFSDTGRFPARRDFDKVARRITASVTHWFTEFGGDSRNLVPSSRSLTRAEQMYHAIQDMARRAEQSDNAALVRNIRMALDSVNRNTSWYLNELARKYGALDVLSIQATQTMQATYATQVMQVMQVTQTVQATYATQVMQVMQAMQRPPVTVASTTAAPFGRLDIPGPAHRIVPGVDPAFPEPAGGFVHATDMPGPCAASGLPGPSDSETTGAEAGGLWRGWLDRPATVSGTTAAQPAATEAIVTPALGGTSSFWLQPVDPVPVPGSAPFDSGLHHAGETVRPPPVATTASSTTPAPVHALPTTSWLHDNFDIERALIAGRLPPGFDASQLIDKARLFDEFGLADELAAGRLPGQTIDGLMEWFRATDEGGDNALIHRVPPLQAGENRARPARCVSGAGPPAVARPRAGGAAFAR